MRRLTSAWRYDGDERYPHVYGPLDRSAITDVHPIERAADATFLRIEGPPSAAATSSSAGGDRG